MKKQIMFIAAAVLGSALCAADFRIDISGVNGIALLPSKCSEGVKASQASWLREKKDQRVVCTIKVTGEWKKYSLSFIPENTGTYDISLMSTSPKFFARSGK